MSDKVPPYYDREAAQARLDELNKLDYPGFGTCVVVPNPAAQQPPVDKVAESVRELLVADR